MKNVTEEGRVYAIDDGQGCVKIGWTKDPVRRLREMNVSDAGRLTLIGSARGTRTHEAKLHRLLKPWRERGEWFRKEGVVLAFLDMLPKSEPPSEREDLAAADFGPDGAEFQAVCSRRPGLRGGIGRHLNLTHSAVYQWRRVPAERVLDVERITGIPRDVLRPDLYPHNSNPSAA